MLVSLIRNIKPLLITIELTIDLLDKTQGWAAT